MEGKVVLVTGGAGFIGSNLCERLVAMRCAQVLSLDNYSLGSESNHIEGVRYIHGETADIFDLVDVIPDVVFHLGEYSRVEQSFTDMERVFLSNKIGTYRVVEFCRVRESKLVYAGSSTKFGDGGLGRSASPYAWTKASNTELIVNYGNWFDLRYAITYFYNVYGPREIKNGKYATLIGLYSAKISAYQELPVVSPGTQRRNFTHVDDIIDGLLLVAEYGHGDEFGIGSPVSYSVIEVANLFGGVIKMLPSRKGNRLDASLDLTRVEQLGWCAKRNLAEYIAEVREGL